MLMDHVEEELRTAGRTVQDPALNQYLHGIACRLAPDHCGGIRIYIIQTPRFNASMAPNGAMEVWTGLTLRAQNEAQLAFVLAHEIAHYVRRHTLQRWRTAHATTDALIFVQLASAAAGVPVVGEVAQLVALASILSFSRDQEREADRLGFEMLVRGGYDPGEAPKIWVSLLEEQEAADDNEPLAFFSTHPGGEERLMTLEALAEQSRASGSEGAIARTRYLDLMLPLRASLLRDEVRQRTYEPTLVLLRRLLESGVRPGEVEFYVGEVHRVRGEPGDLEQAIEFYRSAVESDGAPPEAHRKLGLVYRRLGRLPSARKAFERYLELSPEADDRLMIESYLHGID